MLIPQGDNIKLGQCYSTQSCAGRMDEAQIFIFISSFSFSSGGRASSYGHPGSMYLSNIICMRRNHQRTHEP
jgi:hypothetical protein